MAKEKQEHPGTREELAKSLEERIKELRCLYQIARIGEGEQLSVGQYLRQVVELLPPAWQYPEIASAQILLNGEKFSSKRFRYGRWKQAAPVTMGGMNIGTVEVRYREARPEAAEGPFMAEERELIEEVAKRVGETVTRIAAEENLRESNRLLEKQRQSLRESNAALKAVLSRIRDEELEIKSAIDGNVREHLMPLLDEMEAKAPGSCAPHLTHMRKLLLHITSPFSNRLKDRYTSLTQTELQICKMIRNGLRTKDIAAIRQVSPSTIHRHRERIRKKLGSTNSGVNLGAILQEDFPHDPGDPLQ